LDTVPDYRSETTLKQTFALGFLARKFSRTPHGFGLFTGFLDGGLFEMLPKLHFAKNALALQFLFQGTKRLIDIIVANRYLHVVSPPF